MNHIALMPRITARTEPAIGQLVSTRVDPVLCNVHGSAGEQAVELNLDIAERVDAGAGEADAVRAGLDAFMAAHGQVIPGFACRARLVLGPFAS